MSVFEELKGFKPTANVDGDFPPLVGNYKTRVEVLRKEESTFQPGTHLYQLQLKATETLDGDPANNRVFFRRYQVDDAKAVARLANDVFTMGVTLDVSSQAKFEAGFPQVIGKTAFVRGWSWTPEQTFDGKPLAKEDRKAKQQFVIRKDAGKAKKASAVPF